MVVVKNSMDGKPIVGKPMDEKLMNEKPYE
jgi:hypothetical protein